MVWNEFKRWLIKMKCGKDTTDELFSGFERDLVAKPVMATPHVDASEIEE